jgi:hypothetical protein
VGGKIASLAQLRADGVRAADFLSSARTFPIENDAVANEPLHCIGHIGEPGTSAKFPVRDPIQSNRGLLLECVKDGSILNFTKLFLIQPPVYKVGAGLQELRGTK